MRKSLGKNWTLALLNALKTERKDGVDNGVYAFTQSIMAGYSNESESFTLSPDQIVSIFQKSEFAHEEGVQVNANDVLSVMNSFLLFDVMLDTLERPLDSELIYKFECIATTRFRPVQHVDIDKEIEIYRSKSPDVEDIVDLYKAYIRSGGDRRVGRMMMFRECLVNGVFPFVIVNDDDNVTDAQYAYFEDSLLIHLNQKSM